MALLIIFGTIQIVLLLFANSALGQAATDGTSVTAAQSSSGPVDSTGNPDLTVFPNTWQVDGPALTAVVNSLTSLPLSNVQEVDIFPADANGSPVQLSITQSVDWPGTHTGTQTITLENEYRLTPPPGGPVCQVGPFYLWNSLGAGSTSVFQAPDGDASTVKCVLPWNGAQYSYSQNQNGRDDQRCSESPVYVRIVYAYHPLVYPLLPAITLIAHDEMPIEPRQFTQNITSQQDVTCSQFPSFGS